MKRSYPSSRIARNRSASIRSPKQHSKPESRSTRPIDQVFYQISLLRVLCRR
ncbi:MULTISPECIES: hypothetical protein [unclassified Microcoleus]|uniref:hypothetical protein n=1 Tax=unclassified Microcoleus TaxID=2642155 RepID=UPI002FD61DD8